MAIAPHPSPPAAALARRFVLFYAMWLVIAWQEALVVGMLAAGVATYLSLQLLPPQQRAVRPLRLARQVPGFFWASFLGGLDVIRRAFHPRLPLNPGWIVHHSRLPSSGARVALGSDMSLMPGTLAAGGRGQSLYIHCLDVDQAVERQVAREERRIGQSIGAEDD
ncbi:MAG: Na+/H+ antiporter subunit E [Hyphomicrobiales bacterium]